MLILYLFVIRLSEVKYTLILRIIEFDLCILKLQFVAEILEMYLSKFDTNV